MSIYMVHIILFLSNLSRLKRSGEDAHNDMRAHEIVHNWIKGK